MKEKIWFIFGRNLFLAMLVAYIYYISVNHYQVTAKMLNNLMPENFNYWASLTQEQEPVDVKRFDQSLLYYGKLVRLFPDDTASMNQLGYIYFHSGELEKAKKIYQKSADINPHFLATHYNLGLIHFLQKNYIAAELAFKRCLVSSTERATHFIYSSRAYLPIRKSIPQFDVFIQKKINQEMSWATSLLALSVYLKNFPEVLRGNYRVDPRLEFKDYIYYRLGREAFDLNQYTAAVGFFQESLNINPDYLPALEELRLILQQLGKNDLAAKLLYKQKVSQQTGKAVGTKDFPRLQVF